MDTTDDAIRPSTPGDDVAVNGTDENKGKNKPQDKKDKPDTVGKGPAKLPVTADPAVAKELQKILDGAYAEERERVRAMLDDEFFRPQIGLPLD